MLGNTGAADIHKLIAGQMQVGDSVEIERGPNAASVAVKA